MFPPDSRIAEPVAPAGRVRVGLTGDREQPGEAARIRPRGGEAGPFIEAVHQGLADVGGPDSGRGGARLPADLTEHAPPEGRLVFGFEIDVADPETDRVLVA